MLWRKSLNRFKQAQADSAQRGKPHGGIHHLFHGVAIESGMHGCCPAVLALSGQRFLSEEAPRLPHEQCNQPQSCQCRYRHFSDRRTDLRRATDSGLPERLYPQDRRVSRGRRITDR